MEKNTFKMNQEKLSKRLEQVGQYVPQGAVLLDVGSDHAYLPINLVRAGRIARAIAGEVVKGPYESAVANVAAAGLSQQIAVRLANGLSALDGEVTGVDTVTIAGMGGHLIAEILEKGSPHLANLSTLILQPNNAEAHLRSWLQGHGFKIVAESILAENDKIYEILRVQHGTLQAELTAAELLFGPFLLQERSAVFLKKWESELAAIEKILAQLPATAQAKRQGFLAKVALIKEVLDVSQ
jgi:tRNA (adenine22-N1)-methyltransferase